MKITNNYGTVEPSCKGPQFCRTKIYLTSGHFCKQRVHSIPTKNDFTSDKTSEDLTTETHRVQKIYHIVNRPLSMLVRKRNANVATRRERGR